MNLKDRNTACPAAGVPAGLPESAQERLGRLRVMVAGLGNIGSFLTLLLAPLVGFIRIVDRDTVERHNTMNQLYDLSAVGRPKAEVLAKLIAANGSKVIVDARVLDLEDLPWGDWDDVDFVLAGLDSLHARQLVSERTYTLDVPYIDGAVGDPLLGQVQVWVPRQACTQCGWSPIHYRQLATEYPCHPDASVEGPRTLAPACAGSAVAALMVSQLIRLCSAEPPVESYEINGDLLAGQFISSLRRRNSKCRFDHVAQPRRIEIQVPFAQATVGDIIRVLDERFGADAIQLETRRGIFAPDVFSSSRFVNLNSLLPIADARLSSLGLTQRDRFVVRASASLGAEHLTFHDLTTPVKG